MDSLDTYILPEQTVTTVMARAVEKTRSSGAASGSVRRNGPHVPAQMLGYLLQPIRLLQILLDAPADGFVTLAVFEDVGLRTIDGQTLASQVKSGLVKKLRAIFPYVLGAISAETLARRHQLQQLRRELSRKKQELANISAVSERWRATASARLAEARDLGLGQQRQAAPSYEAPSISSGKSPLLRGPT